MIVFVVVILSSVGNTKFENIFNSLLLVGRRELNSRVRKLLEVRLKTARKNYSVCAKTVGFVHVCARTYINRLRLAQQILLKYNSLLNCSWWPHITQTRISEHSYLTRVSVYSPD